MSDRIFAWLLRLYPSSFRRKYTEEARHLYQARLRDESGFLRRSRLCYDLLADLMAGLPQAYRNSYAPAAALAPDIQANPSFRLLEKEPLRPESILGGGVLALTAVVAVTFAMTCPSSFQPLSPSGTPMSPVEAVMQRLNEATSPDSVGNADRETATFDLGVAAGPQAQPSNATAATMSRHSPGATLNAGKPVRGLYPAVPYSTQHSAQGPHPGHSAASDIQQSLRSSRTIAKLTPTVALSYLPTNPAPGSMVNLTATVLAVGAGPTPTGNVRFFDGSAVLDMGRLNNGTVTVKGKLPRIATHSLSAIYYGDANYSSASSNGERE